MKLDFLFFHWLRERPLAPREDGDYGRFYDWCGRQDVPVFVSSYSLPEDRFKEVAAICVSKLFSGVGASGKVYEKVYVPRHQADWFRASLFDEI